MDIDLFLKEHVKLRNEISAVKDLLGDTLDATAKQQTVKTDLHMKLPEIKMPEFAGNPSEWDQFWGIFSSLIDKRTDIAVSIKFTHLKNALKGPSAKLIAGFAVTEANYKEANELLIKTYKDGRRIQRKLIHRLLDLKTPQHNYKELTEFKITSDQLLRSLKSYQHVDDAD